MDKVKQQLAIALKYGFWIGCVCVFIGSLAVWWMSTSRLEQENSSQVSAITNDIQKVNSLRGELDTQPNEISHAKMNTLIAERTDEVLDAWQKIYQDQLGILTWPTELKESYIDEFRYVRDEETGQLDKDRRKLPFEVYVEYDNELHEVAPTIRVSYARYIKNVLDDIAAIAKTEWTAEFDSRAGGMGMEDMGMMDEMDMGMGMMNRAAVGITGVADEPLVKWSTGSQDSVLSDLFPWRGSRPTTLQVYYSQENLWILKQLLQIVATVNGNARMPFEAKIRAIQQLKIGKSVKLEGIGSIAKPGDGMRGMGGMGMGMDDMDMGMDDMDMMDMDMGMGGMADVDLPDPGDNRYVDTENKPILASALRAALTSKQPGDAPLAVAKRIPVMMSVQIDQRYVPELIAACGSAPLMVEVKQTRILPKGSSQSGMGGGMGMGDMGMEDMGMEDMGMGGMGMGAMPQGPADEFPLDMQVEIYGLIHLYNPPDEEALGVQQVNQDTPVAETSALPAPSATTPAVPAATAPAAADSGTGPSDPTVQPPATTDPSPAVPGDATQPATGTPAAPGAAPTAMAAPN